MEDIEALLGLGAALKTTLPASARATLPRPALNPIHLQAAAVQGGSKRLLERHRGNRLAAQDAAPAGQPREVASQGAQEPC